jgi:signal transduction histidine kinase
MIDERMFVNADELQLKEVFNNLSSNAAKFMEHGGTLTFDAKKMKEENFVMISVKDTGLGMTSEQLNHIFDEFYKADESRHDLSASGLGLPIVKRIVERHGGRIWAESPGPEKGTIFYFTVPSAQK